MPDRHLHAAVVEPFPRHFAQLDSHKPRHAPTASHPQSINVSYVEGVLPKSSFVLGGVAVLLRSAEILGKMNIPRFTVADAP